MQTQYIRYIFILLLLVFVAQIDTSAQVRRRKSKGKYHRLQKRIKKADEFYDNGEWIESIRRYKALVRKIKGRGVKAPIYYKMGNAYYQSYNYKKARTYLKRSIKYDTQNRDAWIKLAECLKVTEKFDEGIALCDDYFDKVGEDSLMQVIKTSFYTAQEWMQVPTRFAVTPVRKFNSKDNDFSPFVVEKDGFDHIYFSTNRKGVKGKKQSQITGQRFSDIMVSKMNRQGKWEDLTSLDSLNTDFDDGTPFVVNSGAQMFYTACLVEKNQKKGCQIYQASKSGKDWMNPERLAIVGDSISVGHPCFSPDGNIMYFAARMTGGFGGSDIWYVEKDGGNWSKPKNMGQDINTPYDEMFPFMRADSTLYFASNRIPNMGGLDLFQAKKVKNSYKWTVENMKYPFSSAGNDFGIYYYANEDKGYFTSDRKGSKGEDIYFFEKPPLKFNLEGFVKDKETLAVVDSAIITLIGSDGAMFSDTSDVNDGFFEFKLKPNTEYVFVVNKTGYFNGKARFSTDTLYFDHNFEYEILLESYNKTFEIPNIEFEFASKELTALAKHSLDSVTQVLIDNPNIVVELAAHTDMVGTDESNMKLSRERADAVKKYLVENGILDGRLTTIGYGESRPVEIVKNHPTHTWLKRGDVLNPQYIESLTDEQKEIANQLNRRTELRVIGHDFVPTLD